jgi:rSAM/selenodomain-associated transferase 1
MFRIPEYGNVKQRLAAQIGHDEALKAYSSMLYDTITNVSRLKGVDIYGFYEGKVSQQANILERFDALPQQGKDLGERMLNAVSQLLKMGYNKVILIGSDSPDIPLKVIYKAIRKLDCHDIVVGPSEDGGYYLLGMKRLLPAVFKDISWGTSAVMSSTLENIKKAKLSVSLLPQWYDIDNLKGLNRWKQGRREMRQDKKVNAKI